VCRRSRLIPGGAADAVVRCERVHGIHRDRLRAPVSRPAAASRTERIPGGTDDERRAPCATLHARLSPPQHLGETPGMSPAAWYRARLTEWTGRRDAAAARGV